MYSTSRDNSGYNPLLSDRSPELKAVEGDASDDAESLHSETPNVMHRESVAWFGSNKIPESMNFDEVESVMWRKHQLRRFFQDRGHWLTAARRTTAWKWALVILIGILVGAVGAFVQIFTEVLSEWRFHEVTKRIDDKQWGAAFFLYQAISLLLGGAAGILCWIVPQAAGSGIPEIKAFLNGVALKGLVRVRVLLAKVIGVCFSVSSGLPIGKEGPMIHIGSIMGAAMSQGKTITFGFDTSWTKFQDFRNDSAKRDFVTYGAAAGIAAAFRAPIGGVLFTLEEGASFWSTTITFRAFFCAMMTMLTVSIFFAGHNFGRSEASSIFSFGQFDSLVEGKTNYYAYEIFVFIFIGCMGGALGALFNHINKLVTEYRIINVNAYKWKRMTELLLYVFVMACISFLLPLMWRKCTAMPSDSSDWTSQERDLLDELVQFQCKSSEYNQLASLYFTPADTALRQLFHYREYDGNDYTTFETGALLLFFIPYFLAAACASGSFAPTGLFVPCIVAGAAFGRLCGHLLNSAFPGYVADSGTYALIGAAALLGGMARMTISGTVIMLEAAGNMVYLLPLMVTFGAARYTGNAINHGLYEMQIDLQKLPFLPGNLRSLGLLNYFPIHEIMAHPVYCFNRVEKVGNVFRILSETEHNGFPVLGKNGHLVGLILRKTLCSLLKLKAYSVPQARPQQGGLASMEISARPSADGGDCGDSKILQPAATVFYDTLERNYPRYPRIADIKLTAREMELFIDLRPYMDTAPYSINQSASVQRCYRQFRTMGLRHMVVVDSDHLVVGMITRKDLTERRLDLHWYREGHNLQKFINLDHLPPAVVCDDEAIVDEESEIGQRANQGAADSTLSASKK
mmetsp:Transcript_1158/g.1880  ORF Transcript_1158/g.1880 Transcript_1158/m.1880 type:complete len:856 (-) Transcript_1158:190-2757(-)